MDNLDNVWLNKARKWLQEHGMHISEIKAEYYLRMGSTAVSIHAMGVLMKLVQDRYFPFFLFEELAYFVFCVVMWREAEKWLEFFRKIELIEEQQVCIEAIRPGHFEPSTAEPQLPVDTESDIEIIEEDSHADCCMPVEDVGAIPSLEDCQIVPGVNTDVAASETSDTTDEFEVISNPGSTGSSDLGDWEVIENSDRE